MSRRSPGCHILGILAVLLEMAVIEERLEAGECRVDPRAETQDTDTEIPGKCKSGERGQNLDEEASDFLNRRLPEWLELGLQIRIRGEGRQAHKFVDNDNFLLSRFRFQVGARPASWLRLFVQGQDSRVVGLDLDISKLADPADLRQAYAYLGMSRIGLRAGRMEMKYGDERLIGASNWSNTSRSFDAVRLELEVAGGRTDIFASSVIQIDPVQLNGRSAEEKLYGVYSAFGGFSRDGNLDAYILAKTADRAPGEDGVGGKEDFYTGGFRMVSRWDIETGELTLSMEAARQWGRTIGGNLSAWAGYGIITFAPHGGRSRPRLSAEFSYASGDAASDDEKIGTFDQLYPTNHSKYGIVDLVGWRNIKDLRFGVDLEPHPALEIAFDFHSFWLASPSDHLYDSGGRVVVPVPESGAADGHVGWETDVTVVYSVTSRFSLGAGFGHVFPGPFLEDTTAIGPSFAYAFVQYEL